MLTCTIVDGDDGMCRCQLDDMANANRTVDVPHCLVVSGIGMLWLSWLLCAEVGVGG